MAATSTKTFRALPAIRGLGRRIFAPLAQVQVYSCAPGQCTPLQAAFAMENQWINTETFIPFFWDPPGLFCPNGCSSLGPYVFWDPQFFSLFGWSSFGNSSYHALQTSFRKRFSHGVQFDLNYAYSKSIDLSSDAARVAPRGGTSLGSGGIIVNSWNPKQMRAVSDFDMTHQFNANWVSELPFGRGQRFAANAHGWVNAVIGGWQFSGIYRITSGLPFSVRDGRNNFPTNGGINGSLATLSGVPIKTGTTKTPDGLVLMFPDTNAAFNGFQFTAPGQSGSRNVLRGDGFVSWDSSLSKRWQMSYNEHHSLQFRWEVFNVPNSTRFNVQSNLPALDQKTSFGQYTGLLTNPRVMQFALRYEF